MFADRIPKGYKENLEWRRHVWERCQGSRRIRAAVLAECKHNLLFWISTFCMTFDPRLPEGRRKAPFVPYPFQESALLTIQEVINNPEPLVVNKVRELGFTWQVLLVFDHFSIFTNDCKFLLISRNERLVDNSDDMDALMQRLDFVHAHLPEWMLAPEDVTKRKMIRTFERTKAVITGATTTKEAGVGGRATGILIDEFSRFESAMARSIQSGIADLSSSRIFVFTPNPEMGKQHPSYALVKQAKEGKIRGIHAHWRDHPKKNIGLYRVDPATREVEIHDKTFDFTDYKFQTDGRFEWHSQWFDKERIQRGNDEMTAEMLELDWSGSGTGVFDPLMIHAYAVEHCRPPDVEGDLDYDESTGACLGFAVFRGGPIRLWSKLDVRSRLPVAPYGVGCDVSLGVGKTPSCASAGRLDTGEKLVEFTTATMKPDEFAIKVLALCHWLSWGPHSCKLVWEQNGPGNTFGAVVIKMGYTNLFYEEDELKTRYSRSTSPGWNPQRNMMLLDKYRSGLSRRAIINPSREALEQTLEFVYIPGGGVEHKSNRNRKIDVSGATANHGDLGVSDALLYLLMSRYVGRAFTAPPGQEETALWKAMFAEPSRDRVLYPHRGRC